MTPKIASKSQPVMLDDVPYDGIDDVDKLGSHPEQAGQYTHPQRRGYPGFGQAKTTNHIHSRTHAEVGEGSDAGRDQGLSRREAMEGQMENDQFPYRY